MLRALALTALIFSTLQTSAEIIGDVTERRVQLAGHLEPVRNNPPAAVRPEAKVAPDKPVKPGKKFECTKKISEGVASVYGLNNGSGDSSTQRLATPGRLNVKALTAAMLPPVPLYSWVEVTNKRSGKSVIVQVLDRGPYARGRVIDLTPAAGCAIGIPCTGQGSIAPVVVKSCKRVS